VPGVETAAVFEWLTVRLTDCFILNPQGNGALAMFREKRRSQRIERKDGAAVVSLTGALIMECVLEDISVTGARISVAMPEAVPDYFKLRIETQDELSPKCRVRWRSGNEFGVEFFRRT
jgi:hypothetical protein